MYNWTAYINIKKNRLRQITLSYSPAVVVANAAVSVPPVPVSAITGPLKGPVPLAPTADTSMEY